MTKKRKTSASSSCGQSDTDENCEPSQKSQKNSDDRCVDFSSYPSTLFTLDVSTLLIENLFTNTYTLLFKNEDYKDLIIQEIIKEFDQSFIKNNNDVTTSASQDDDDILNHRKEFGTRLTTHGHMNISDGIQNKRNQCRVVAHPSVKEMYMCVKSQEFNPSFNCGNDVVFVFNGWLVYKCERMKTNGTDSYNVFQTKSKMFGNMTDIKSIHWLALHYRGYCSIRTLDEQVVFTKDCPSIAKDTVEISTIQEHLEISNRTSTWLKIIPYSLAKEKGIEPVVKWQDYYSTLTSTSKTFNNHVNNSTLSSTTNMATTSLEATIESEPLENNLPNHNYPIIESSKPVPVVQDDDCDTILENLLVPLSPVHTVNYLEASALPVGSSEIPSIQHDEESSNNNTEKTSLSQEYDEFSTFDKHLEISGALTNSLFENFSFSE